MVKCLICNTEFKRVTAGHLKKHSYSLQDYTKKYPEALLISEETLTAYSEGTKRYFKNNPNEAQRRVKNRVLSPEGRKVHSENMKRMWESRVNDLITDERNKKISKAKTLYWQGRTECEKSDFIKSRVVPKVRERMGEEAYRAQLREKGLKGYQTLMYKGSAKMLNNFEQEMVDQIIRKGYICITQFEVDKWYYDSYLPEKNLIIEFDGDYWHPKTLEDCTNDRLKRQWHIDRMKDELAIKKGYKIIRIRESEKHLLTELI